MRVRDFFNKLEEYLLIGGMAFIVILVFAQVIMRYIFLYSPAWVQELCTYIFIWGAWIGASYAIRQHSHLRIRFVLEKFNGRWRLFLEVVSLLIWFLFCVFLAWTGTQLVIFLFRHGELSIAMRIPIGYAYASVPVGGALMGIRLVSEIVSTLKKVERWG